jgi:hypothetical protein
MWALLKKTLFIGKILQQLTEHCLQCERYCTHRTV